MRERIKKQIKGFVIILLTGICYAFFWSQTGIAIPCLFYKITGLYCAGCGISRMCLSILQAQFYQAFRWNPGVFVMIPVLLFYLISESYYDITQKEKKNQKVRTVILSILIFYFILYTILRNISYFSYLVPTNIAVMTVAIKA